MAALPRRLGLQALAVALATLPARADGTLERFKLDNGLTVILRPVEGAEVVVVTTFFSIGSYQDPEGRSGLGHLVEHLYVSSPAGDTPARHGRAFFDAYDQKAGATTGFRYTRIWCAVAPERLEAEIRDAAARMGSLRIEQSDLDEERRHVCGEVKEEDLHPPHHADTLARLRVRPLPNGGSQAGLVEELNRVTLKDARDRWRNFYKPRNAVLVVAGAVKPVETRALVTRFYAPLAAGEAAPTPGRCPAGQPGMETVRHPCVRADEKPYVCHAWAAPDPDSEDFAPFLILAMRAWEAGVEATPSWDVVYTPLVNDTLVLRAPREDPFAKIDPILDALHRPWDPDSSRLGSSDWAFRLGLETPPDAKLRDWESGDGEDLCGLAHGLGLREILGFDVGGLERRLKAVTAKDLERAQELFAASRRATVVLEAEPLPK